MVNDLVSIIMPSYNTGKFISASIRSVQKQTWPKWELLIVDDASTDNTDEVIMKFKDDRIRYFKNDKNYGAALSRNRALRKASGEYIAFLDSDDLWQPFKLEHQINFMRQNNYAFSYHEYEKINEEGKPLNIYVSGPDVVTERKMLNYCYPGFLTVMYRHDVEGLIQVKDIKKNNDYAILLKLCKNASCFLLKENLAQYRIRKSSISHDKLYKKVKSHYDLFHFCEEKSVPISIWLTLWNMFYGVRKKLKYETRILSV